MKLQRSLLAITVALTGYNFARALIGLFVPLILLRNGALLWQVAAFYVAYAVVKLFINYPVMLLIQRRGPALVLAVGFVSSGVQIAALRGYTAEGSEALLLLAAAGLSFSNACVWNAMHSHISQVIETTTKSSSVATIESLSQLTGLFGPLLGGVIGYAFGSGTLLAVAGVLTLVSLIPLIYVPGLTDEFSGGQRLRYSLGGAPRRDLFANFSFNIETAIGNMVWPIYLAVVISTYRSIGLIGALSGLATVVIIQLAGRRGDSGADRAVLREGAVASAVIHLLRLVVTGPIGITLISMGYKASLGHLQNAWTSTYYHHANQRGLPYVMSMEIACDVAYLTLWLLLLGVALVGSTTAFFAVAFAVAAVASFGCLTITRQTAASADGLPT